MELGEPDAPDAASAPDRAPSRSCATLRLVVMRIQVRLASHHDAKIPGMRTTVSLDEDVAAAIQRLRRERGLGLSEALNQLARTGLTVKRSGPPFRQRAVALGLKVDVTNVAEALELLDGPAAR